MVKLISFTTADHQVTLDSSQSFVFWKVWTRYDYGARNYELQGEENSIDKTSP